MQGSSRAEKGPLRQVRWHGTLATSLLSDKPAWKRVPEFLHWQLQGMARAAKYPDGNEMAYGRALKHCWIDLEVWDKVIRGRNEIRPFTPEVEPRSVTAWLWNRGGGYDRSGTAHYREVPFGGKWPRRVRAPIATREPEPAEKVLDEIAGAGGEKWKMVQRTIKLENYEEAAIFAAGYIVGAYLMPQDWAKGQLAVTWANGIGQDFVKKWRLSEKARARREAKKTEATLGEAAAN